MSFDPDMPDWMRPVDTMAEHYAHEENSYYDQYDGLRGEMFYDEDPGCPDCYNQEEMCADCAECRDQAIKDIKAENDAREARNARENDPNCADYVPF